MILISKEQLQADLHFLFDDYGNPVSDLARQVIDVVSGADEAYNVDKVVEEMAELHLPNDDDIGSKFRNSIFTMMHNALIEYFVEIVRKGGVDV